MKKGLIEIEEKVQKDDDRRKKILEELENLRKNYENARRDYDKQVEERNLIHQKMNELNAISKEKDELKEKIQKDIKLQIKEINEMRKNVEQQN